MHDVARWAAALSTLVGFGLALGLNPALYGATADMLARNTHVAARMASMIAGLFAGATILYIVLQSFDPAPLVASVEQGAGTVVRNRPLDIVAGCVFLVGAAAVAWWRLRVPERPASTSSAKAGRSWTYFTLGLSCSIIGFTTLPIMYMTGRVAAAVSVEPWHRLLAYAVFLVALAAPFVLLAGAWSLFPGTAARVTRVYTRIIHLDFRWVYVAILATAGVLCIGFGLLAGR